MNETYLSSQISQHCKNKNHERASYSSNDIKGKGKGKRRFVCCEHTRVLKGSHSFTCTPRVHPVTEWTIPAFSFPAEAGITHIPIQKGWKAELALLTIPL